MTTTAKPATSRRDRFEIIALLPTKAEEVEVEAKAEETTDP
jgi:hypothetical protein